MIVRTKFLLEPIDFIEKFFGSIAEIFGRTILIDRRVMSTNQGQI